LGFSIDTVPSKKAWAQSLGIEKTSLVSDFWPHGGYSKELGIFRDDDGFTERANIIIDEKGFAKWIKIYPIPQLPDIKEVLEALK
jgi:alkyl hydroperoxide reductase subunit AhpC